MRILTNAIDTLRDLRHPKYRVTVRRWDAFEPASERVLTVRAWDPEDAYWRAVVKGLGIAPTHTWPVRITGDGHDLDLTRPCGCGIGCPWCGGATYFPAVVPDGDCTDCHGDGLTEEPDGRYIPCGCLLTALAAHWTP